MKFTSREAGFTLIELLVVIAIIGILSSVVLASLSTSRAKASDSIIKTQLKQLQTQSHLYLLENSKYGTNYNHADTCANAAANWTSSMFTMPGSQAVIQKALDNAGTPPSPYLPSFCRLTTQGTYNIWAAAVALKTDPGKSFCVDSTGFAKVVNRIPIGAVGSPGQCANL